MTDIINFFLAHPVLMAMLSSVLSILSADIKAYVQFRNEHPGASYDFVVVLLRLFDGMLVPVTLAMGAMGYQAVTQ